MSDNPEIEKEVRALATSDEELIARASGGDAVAFESLVNRYRKPALRLARRFMGRESEAEDLAQDAFLQVHRYAHRYDPEIAPFKAWFFTILGNLCRNAAKKGKSLSLAEPPLDATATNDPEGDFAREEWRIALAAALARLTPNQRSVLILRYYEDFSCAEAAEALDLSVKAVEALSTRARRRLRRELGKFGKKICD